MWGGKRKKKSPSVFIAAVPGLWCSAAAAAAWRARRITAHLSRPARSPRGEERLLLLAAGWRLCVASLSHDPAQPPSSPPPPVSQQRRPSQMLHGGAGVRHSIPDAPNASQLLHAWTTTTITTAVASWIHSLPDRQSISACLRGEPVFVFVKLQCVQAFNRKEDWGPQEEKNITDFFLFCLFVHFHFEFEVEILRIKSK